MRCIDWRRRAAQQDRASVSHYYTRHHLDHSRFPCAIVAEESQHLAAVHCERDIIDGTESSEPLTYVPQFKKWHATDDLSVADHVDPSFL